MAQELQELAKTPWTREQWIDQVRCVQDGCDDTPNEEEEHGTSLDSIMRKAAMIRNAAIGVVRKETKAQNDLLRRARDIASRGGLLDETFLSYLYDYLQICLEWAAIWYKCRTAIGHEGAGSAESDRKALGQILKVLKVIETDVEEKDMFSLQQLCHYSACGGNGSSSVCDDGLYLHPVLVDGYFVFQ